MQNATIKKICIENQPKPYSGPPNPDPYDEQERAAILEFDAGMERAEAEQESAVMTRPPTVAEAVEWLKKMQHCPEYCRACLTAWKASMGVAAALQVFYRAPESVRQWINERKAK